MVKEDSQKRGRKQIGGKNDEKCIRQYATPEQWSIDQLSPGGRDRQTNEKNYQPTLSTLDNSGGDVMLATVAPN